MPSKLTPIVFVAFFVAAAGACGGPPKQAEVPDADKETGIDMAPSDSAPAAEGEKPSGGEDEMRTKCCGECKTALSQDRSGSAPDTIPCADFASLSPWCREHFLSHPKKASECQ
jgi:hypothetical protein